MFIIFPLGLWYGAHLEQMVQPELRQSLRSSRYIRLLLAYQIMPIREVEIDISEGLVFNRECCGQRCGWYLHGWYLGTGISSLIMLKRAFSLENFTVNGKLLKGTKAKAK